MTDALPDDRPGPRVLLSAYQCGPGMGSVSQIGWEWYRRLARRVPTTLVTHVRNRAALEAAGAPLAGGEILWVDTEWFAGPLYRLARHLFPRSEHAVFLLSSLDFFVHDPAATRLCRARQRAGQRWDVVHAVTPVSTVAPTHLHRLGLPVILGPLNGGIASPPAFREILREDAAWLYPLRALGRAVDLVSGSTRRARVILTATRATLASMPRSARARCVPMLENAVDLERFAPAPWPAAPGADGPLRLLFVGRLVPFKGLPMLLAAMAQVRPARAVRLDVVGDGPMAGPWQERARQLGLGTEVVFHGAAPLERVSRAMRECHLLCLPSVRESGGAVLLEAMACGRPVLAIDFGGPAELVDDTVGRAVAPEGPAAVSAALASALEDVFRHPEAWRRRAEAAAARARARYGWDDKIDEAVHLYERVAHG